jgi:DNA-directed RNA polymerase subunit RPC12/RpoP
MEKKCCICGKTFIEYANNAAPVKNGICCNSCNSKFVINSRILNWQGTFEIARNPKELESLEDKLAGKNFELMSDFHKSLKRYENIETGENVIICVL